MKRFFAFCMVVLLCTACGSESRPYGQDTPLQSVNTAMGTIVSQTIYIDKDLLSEKPEDSSAIEAESVMEADIGSEQDTESKNVTRNEQNSDKITDGIILTITDLEQNLLSWRLESSEIYRVNAAAGQEHGINLSPGLKDILEQCLAVSDASQGAFDITVGEVVRLWDIDRWAGEEDVSAYVLPKEEAIVQALSNTGYKKLTLQEGTLTLPEKIQLDLGAVGKGIALDSLQVFLQEREEIAGAVISVGGSILTYGQKPDGTPWRVGVVNPMNPAGNIGYLELTGQWCISTSGDYERYVEIDNMCYHHILNPGTGYPADSGLRSVTILAKDGLLSDALSTACFILGQEKGSALLERYAAEAIFVDKDGKLSMTEGMEQYFHLSK